MSSSVSSKILIGLVCLGIAAPVPAAAQTTTWYRDADADLFGNRWHTLEALAQPAGYTDNNNDCDDSDIAVNPGEAEIPNNGVDENCDGQDDNGSGGSIPLLTQPTDLSVSIGANPDPVTAGGEVTYTVTVTNLGATPVTGITIVNVFPSQCTSVAWTSTASGGASSGSGTIDTTLNLASTANATYTATCQVDAAASGSFTNRVTVGPPAGFSETNSSNNAASATVSVNAPVEPAPKSNAEGLIGDLQRERAGLILANGPDSSRRIGRLNGGTGRSGPLAYSAGSALSGLMIAPGSAEFSYSLRKTGAPLAAYAGEDGAAFPLTLSKDAPGQRWDIWLEGSYSRFDATAGSGNFGILHTGADYLFTPDLLAGIGTQFDWIDMDAATGDGSANGWGFMVGPYMTARLAPSLYLDARAAWGQSFNRISPLDTFTDRFDSQRWLATAALIGDFAAGAYTLSPELRLSWFREKSDAYQSTDDVAVPSVTVETGTFEFGPTVSRSVLLDNGATLTPFATISGVWVFEQKNTASALSAQSGVTGTHLRARTEAGLDIKASDGVSLSISGNYDGIGVSGYESYGGKARLSKTF